VQHVNSGFFQHLGYLDAALNIRLIAAYAAGNNEIRSYRLADFDNYLGSKSGSIDQATPVVIFSFVNDWRKELAD
jgi:hypothetical protein